MSCRPAPACKAALAEATRIAPNRNTASDGICASPQHHQQNPTSDHETGEAWDLTHDPANGCDVDVFFGYLIRRRDARVKYLIRNKRILRSYDKPGIPAWTWSEYTGPNPHVKHGHCSIVSEARNNTAPWFGAPTPPPEPAEEENDDMDYIVEVTDDNSPVYYWVSPLQVTTIGSQAELGELSDDFKIKRVTSFEFDMIRRSRTYSPR